MNFLKPVIVCIGVACMMFIAFSILDVLIAFFNLRFYSQAAFVVTFGVGGVFAACFGYFMAMERARFRDNSTRWVLIITLIILGLIFFFVLARFEEGQYVIAFKAFGATMALASLLFTNGDPY